MSFFEIFNPSLRHAREQKDLEKVLVVTDGEGRGPWGRDNHIDLDGGRATLVRRPAPEPEGEAEEPAPNRPDDRQDPPTDS